MPNDHEPQLHSRFVRRAVTAISGGVLAMILPAPGIAETSGATARPAMWPQIAAAVPPDAALEARLDQLLARMSVEDMVGQLIQVDIANIEPDDLLNYKLGSILNGGGSGPYGDDKAPQERWLRLADEFHAASMTRSDGRPLIPVIWGTDAVHGNNNVPGATLFPHNIGLGAANNPGLVRRIGEITALETAAAGQDWTFAPTVAVAQDDRWGRTYESYSEEPHIVEALAEAMVIGLQGEPGSQQFLAPGRVVSSTKHFLADGGTDGRDQGNAEISERELIDIHFPGYAGAIRAGTQIIMASFSSWNGVKMTINRSLMTGVLKERVGFDGFIVSDWNGHGQVPGCTTVSCPSAIEAGLDMFMYSGNDWRTLYANTLEQVRSGAISQTRLHDAVRRILRVKLRAGLFEAGAPSGRPRGGRFELIGAPEHRAVARQAVRESIVLLKNEGVLPLRPDARILVTGDADDVAQAAGGWTITWQGDNLTNADFPGGQSIWSGIEEVVLAAGGTAQLSPDGSFVERPDAAIVVFGEKPYAEILGDRPSLEFSPTEKAHLELLRRLRTQNIPVVAVFLSGRPMWVNAELNAADAFVAAFLPGSEGAGLADVLFTRPDGAVAHDFTGRLSFSWPRRPDQFNLDRRDANYDPLFPFGYGLSYAEPASIPTLDETRPLGTAIGTGPIFGRGGMPDGWALELRGPAQRPGRRVEGASGELSGLLSVRGSDRRSQEDSRTLEWSGRAPAEARIIVPAPVDLSPREAAGEALVVELRTDGVPRGEVSLGLVSRDVTRVTLPISQRLHAVEPGAWQTLAIPLRCFAAAGIDLERVTAPFLIASDEKLALTISDVRLGDAPADEVCPGEME